MSLFPQVIPVPTPAAAESEPPPLPGRPIRELHQQLQSAINAGDRASADDLFIDLLRAASTDPDLRALDRAAVSAQYAQFRSQDPGLSSDRAAGVRGHLERSAAAIAGLAEEIPESERETFDELLYDLARQRLLLEQRFGNDAAVTAESRRLLDQAEAFPVRTGEALVSVWRAEADSALRFGEYHRAFRLGDELRSAVLEIASSAPADFVRETFAHSVRITAGALTGMRDYVRWFDRHLGLKLIDPVHEGSDRFTVNWVITQLEAGGILRQHYELFIPHRGETLKRLYLRNQLSSIAAQIDSQIEKCAVSTAGNGGPG